MSATKKELAEARNGYWPHPPTDADLEERIELEKVYHCMDETIVISRKRLREGLGVLIVRLPDLLGENGNSMPFYMKAVMPGLRMFLASEDIGKAFGSDEVIEAVWEALKSCQNA
jgi:hypothetical protein